MRSGFGIVACALAASASALQLHLTLHPDPDWLVATWTTLTPATGAPLVQYGPGSDKLTHTVFANATTYAMDTCPQNTTRTTYVAAFPAPRATDTYLTVSTDGGSTWSAVFGPTHAPRTQFPFTLTLFGDLGVDTGNIPNSEPQLAQDAASGAIGDLIVHFGDSAYNMDDSCGQVGDNFLDTVSSYAARIPVAWGNGNHETGPNFKYSEFVNRLALGQHALAAASGSSTTRWYSFVLPGVATVFMLDADAWIYPEVLPMLAPQYAWLVDALPRVNRTDTPWLILTVHRALYCTKSTDPECNLEAETLRNGMVGGMYALEPLLLKYGVDMVFAGHTHHYERTWPVARNASTAKDYVNPRAPVHVQSGIAGTGGGDPFSVPQMEWEAYRDLALTPSFGRIVLHDAHRLTYTQLRNADGSVLDTFSMQQKQHGPFRA